MDRVAIISDIHGNMPALEVVLSDIEQKGVARIYCLGDTVGKGPDSAEVVDICRERCQEVVLGNWDDFVMSDNDNQIFLWHRKLLGEGRLDYLKNLPNKIDFLMSGRHIRLFHASATSVHDRVFPFGKFEILLDQFKNTEFTGYENPEPDIVGYGDIHFSYTLGLFSSHKMIFNTGSVGCPVDEARASYVMLEGDLNAQEITPFSINTIKLPYDIELAVQQAIDAGVPELAEHIQELRTAVYRGIQNN
jgi:protein phosphatase